MPPSTRAAAPAAVAAGFMTRSTYFEKSSVAAVGAAFSKISLGATARIRTARNGALIFAMTWRSLLKKLCSASIKRSPSANWKLVKFAEGVGPKLDRHDVFARPAGGGARLLRHG